MLVDEPMALVVDPIFAIIGNGKGSDRIEAGCYQIGHFGSSDFLRGYEQYPDLDVGPYGVCDSLEQLKAKCPELSDPSRRFVVTLTEVRKDEQPNDGGWRWHKWGEYIGDHKIEHEYLADEEGIERVFCFHIYEKV
jgi:hypothetical protein